MEHARRLEICELCSNKDFSPKSGVICSLTSQRPDFEESCKDFSLDSQMIAKKRRLDESQERLQENSRSNVTTGGGVSPVRIVISVIVAILLLARLLVRCSHMQ